MPLRDHFRAPLDNSHSWEELHGQWPAVIVQQLRKKLPAAYEAAPGFHSGSQVEVATFERDESPSFSASEENGGVALATTVWAPPSPVSLSRPRCLRACLQRRLYRGRGCW